jgi:small subunit ribosomal protein S1
MDQNNNELEQEGTPEDTDMENHNMASLLEQEGLNIDFPRQGEIREGVIASISSSQILVSIGAKSEGIIGSKEIDRIPEEERTALQVGQEIPVFIINPEDQNGNLVLSYTRAQEEVSWEQAEQLLASKESYSSNIIGYNKGGLIVPVGRLRGFVPASQISLSRRANLTGDTPEQRWGLMVGEEIEVRVIEVDRDRRRLILSERAASNETRETLKEKVIEGLEVGEIRTGRVTSLADFGAFVNISGADGLVHLSEIAWERIQHPSEVLKVGQETEVKIISIDREKKRIGLSIRLLLEDPWSKQVEKYQVGQLVESTITRLTKFGAFARLEDDLEGLIHISEISEKRIEHPKEVLHEGDVITLRIIKIDPENHRIGLSSRRVESLAYADMDWETLLDDPDAKVASDDTEVKPEVEASLEETVNEEPAVEEPAVEEPAVEESAVEVAGEEESADKVEESGEDSKAEVEAEEEPELPQSPEEKEAPDENDEPAADEEK